MTVFDYLQGFLNAAALAADTSLTYTAGQPKTVAAGDVIRTRSECYSYLVAASVATDNDAVTTGGVKLYVIPQRGEIWDKQFFDNNDADRINRAIAKAVTLTDTGVLHKVMVQGLYTLDKPIKAFKWTGTAFSFTSIHIEAPAQGYVGAKRTRFMFTDGQNPGIVTQQIRQLTIKNISIVGAANSLPLPSYDDLLDRNNWWNTTGAVDSGPFRKHTGICIDPFWVSQAASDKFPYFDGGGVEPNHYVASTGAGSTQITITHCEIQGWVCGVMCAASGVQIGDSIILEKCNLSANGQAVIIGESQNRGIHINDCHAKGFDVFLCSGSGYGDGTGSGGFINGGVFLYGYAMMNVDCSRGQGAMNDVYAESIWTLGNVTGHMGWQFANCNMKFIGNSNGRGVASVLMGAGSVTFDGGYYGHYNNQPHQIAIGTQYTVQGGTCFNNAPVPINLSGGNLFAWLDGVFRYGAGAGQRISGKLTGSLNAVLAQLRYSLPGMPWAEAASGATGYWECVTGPNTTYIGTATVLKSAGGVITLTGIDTKNIFINDTLIGGTSQTISNHNNGVVSSQFYTMGVVSSIDAVAGCCVLSAGAVDLENGKNYAVYVYSFPSIRRPVIAAMTSGSPILTDAGIATADWAVGQSIKGNGIPGQTRVSAVISGQITMTKNATATQTADIYDGLFLPVTVRRTAAPTVGRWPTGSFVANMHPALDANNMVLTGWICTMGGSPGTWRAVYNSSISPAT